MEEEPIKKSDEECAQLLQLILDAYPDFLKTIIPEGWEKSDYVKFFHPTAEQQLEEHKRFSENLSWLKKDKTEEEKKVSLSDFKQDFSDLDVEYETIYLLGLCLWDVFSNNHSVIADDGSEYDIGSWRGSGRFISGLLNDYGEKHGVKERFDYLSFYMGTIWIQGRSNLQSFFLNSFFPFSKNKTATGNILFRNLELSVSIMNKNKSRKITILQKQWKMK